MRNQIMYTNPSSLSIVQVLESRHRQEPQQAVVKWILYKWWSTEVPQEVSIKAKPKFKLLDPNVTD